MDKRKNNGGHSTKAIGVDRRKNEYKEALALAGGVDELVVMLKMVYNKAIENEDIGAAKLYLGYYLGTPTETKEIEMKGEQRLFNIIPITD